MKFGIPQITFAAVASSKSTLKTLCQNQDRETSFRNPFRGANLRSHGLFLVALDDLGVEHERRVRARLDCVIELAVAVPRKALFCYSFLR